MQRYLEIDEIFFSEKNSTEKIKSESNSKSILENYTNYLIENFKTFFTVHHFHAIIYELEQLNRFKTQQITKQLNKNNDIIQKLFLLFNNIDDSIIHIGSTIPQPQQIYLHYKPIHMIYLRTNVYINNQHNKTLPLKGITNSFVSDLLNTKTINILDESTKKTYDIPIKYLYHNQSCGKNIILPLKLRVLIIDSQTNQYRFGIIGEEACKNNQYRSLIFFIDDLTNISSNYHISSDLYPCFDQKFECENEFLENYFKSYPERLMLRAKEGTMIKIRTTTSNNKTLCVSAIVIKIDCSMMLIELNHSKERIWIYRGSTSIEQMNNYYSTQDKISRRSARQHLSAKRSNAAEIICLNDQMKTKNCRTAEQTIDETSSLKKIFSIFCKSSNLSYLESNKRPRISSDKSLANQTESRILRTRQQDTNSTTSSNHIVTAVQTRPNHVSSIYREIEIFRTKYSDNGNERKAVSLVWMKFFSNFGIKFI